LPDSLRPAGALALAALLGAGLAGLQLAPFVEGIRGSTLLGGRGGLGVLHLGDKFLLSWLVPNYRGNPAVDGIVFRGPNYNESTGFIGVGAGLLAVTGAITGWRRNRPAAVALAIVALCSLGMVYGPI